MKPGDEDLKKARDIAASRCAYRGSSTGSLVVETALLQNLPWTPKDGPLSLYHDIVGSALVRGAVYAYNNGTGLFTDVGTPETWEAAQLHPEPLQPYIHYK